MLTIIPAHPGYSVATFKAREQARITDETKPDDLIETRTPVIAWAIRVANSPSVKPLTPNGWCGEPLYMIRDPEGWYTWRLGGERANLFYACRLWKQACLDGLIHQDEMS